MKRTNTETVINVINETKTTKSSANVGSVVAVSSVQHQLSGSKPNEKSSVIREA